MRELAEWQRNFLKGLFYVSQDTEATRPGCSPRDAAAGAAERAGRSGVMEKPSAFPQARQRHGDEPSVTNTSRNAWEAAP